MHGTTIPELQIAELTFHRKFVNTRILLSTEFIISFLIIVYKLSVGSVFLVVLRSVLILTTVYLVFVNFHQICTVKT